MGHRVCSSTLFIVLIVPGCGAGAGANLADFATPPADLGPAATCYGLHFDGIAGSAVTPPLPDPPGSFTLEAWVRPESLVANHEVALASRGAPFNAGDGYDLELEALGAGGFRVVGQQRTATLASPQEAVSTAAWSHLAGVFDSASATLSFFLDGHLQTSTPTRSVAFPLQMAPLVIGGNSASCPCVFQGYIAEVRLSATARYATDFTPAPRLDADSDTLALYHLDESGGTVAHDASTGHADATLMNGAAFAMSTVCR